MCDALLESMACKLPSVCCHSGWRLAAGCRLCQRHVATLDAGTDALAHSLGVTLICP
jgi:hypothetical protein